MSFLTGIFLWAGIATAIPIAIALWNRRRFRKEKFGGYYFLRKVLESTKRRMQLLQLIKLLNRIALFIFLIFLFAEPLTTQLHLKGVGEGFAIILDVGRSLQSKNPSGESLAEAQYERIRETLDQMPSEVQGSILFAGESCSSLRLEAGRLTATADEWLEKIRPSDIAYRNEQTRSSGLSQCEARATALFSGRDIYKVFISALPASLDLNYLESSDLVIERLEAPEFEDLPQVEIRQTAKSDRTQVQLESGTSWEAFLIQAGGELEALGEVKDQLDLLPLNEAWLWLRSAADFDLWAGNEIFRVQSAVNDEVTLWAKEESRGYLSLLSALRSHPSVKVIRQVGGEPLGDAVIIYGEYPYSLEPLKRAWFFLSPGRRSPFQVRDQKQWSPGLTPDLMRSFLIQTGEKEIFVKRYALMDLDRLETLESFQDGAPSLMRYVDSDAKVWVTPFDLEDLTTDLSLEPTFIPYLYERLNSWLSSETSENEDLSLAPLWLLDGAVTPQAAVLRDRAWPGIYGSEGNYDLVEPVAAPREFLSLEQEAADSELVEEEVSSRKFWMKWVAGSVLLELLLCVISARFGVLALLLAMAPLTTWAQTKIPTCTSQSINGDRFQAVEQLVVDIAQLSNLDFSKPRRVQTEDYWKCSMVTFSSSGSWKGFTRSERERVRDYLDRGGLLFFDDPLASTGTAFYRSVEQEMSKLLPGRGVEDFSKDEVVFRSYYLLGEVSGRRLASPALKGIKLNDRFVVLFSNNDILGANLRSSTGDFLLSVSPYGVMQRILARRLFLNIMMYSVTLDYKDDAIHLPHILQRRVR